MTRSSLLPWLAAWALLLAVGQGPPRAGPAARANPAASPQAATTALPSAVASGGGRPAAGAAFGAVGSLGQPTPIGVGSAGATTLHAGFWAVYRRLVPTGADLPDVPPSRLLQNVPNPFNPATAIAFEVGAEGRVGLEIYDLRGARVRVLLDAVLPRGRHEATWDGRDDLGRRVPSGTYCYRLRIGGFSAIRKMMLLK